MSDKKTLTEAIYCTSVHCNSPRCVREAKPRRPPQQRTRGKCLNAHLHTYTHPALQFAAGEDIQPTPSPLCELARWPLFGTLPLCIWGVNSD